MQASSRAACDLMVFDYRQQGNRLPDPGWIGRQPAFPTVALLPGRAGRLCPVVPCVPAPPARVDPTDPCGSTLVRACPAEALQSAKWAGHPPARGPLIRRKTVRYCHRRVKKFYAGRRWQAASYGIKCDHAGSATANQMDEEQARDEARLFYPYFPRQIL